MRARRGVTVAGAAAALVLVGGPAWADDPEPLPDGCRYVDAPTADPADPSTDTAELGDPGDGQVVVCTTAAQPGGFTVGGGGLETADTAGVAAELPRTGSGTGTAALLGLSLVVGGAAVVLSARAPRRT